MSFTRRPNRNHDFIANQDADATSFGSRSTPVYPLALVDLLWMLAGLVFTLSITYVLSKGRIFWEDEMLGWMLLRDPSWHHMLASWHMGADGGGITFYLSGRAWFYVFGASDLSFRLYSSTCFGLAFAVTWAAARQFYARGIVAFALINTWFFCPVFTLHMREGRFYGLLTLSVALAIWLAFALEARIGRTSIQLYVAVFMVHGMLTTSHLLGVVFSAFLLGATALTDVLRGRWRPMVYLSGAASWLLLLVERENIVASARVGIPHFWVKPPTFRDFLGAYTGWSSEIAVVLGVLACAATLTLLLRSDGWYKGLRNAYRARRPVYVVTGMLLTVPIAFLFEGLIGTWLFTERYLLPVTIALAFATAEGCELILSSERSRAWQQGWRWQAARGVFSVAFAAALLFWVFHHVKEFTPSTVDYTGALNAKLPTDVPVVCEDAFSFVELLGHQHPKNVPYMFLLDWNQSVSPSAPRLEVAQYHLMENWKKAGYFSNSIEQVEPFLRDHPRFLVIHAGPAFPTKPPEIGNPLAERLSHHPEYEVQRYASLKRADTVDTVWLVCRGGCPVTAAAAAPR